jgi:hypothetical protein
MICSVIGLAAASGKSKDPLSVKTLTVFRAES